MAETRLRLLKNRLQDAEVPKKCVEVVDGYIKEGHARRVPENELKTNEGSMWCLPHNAAVHPQEPEKVRVVFDWAAKYKLRIDKGNASPAAQVMADLPVDRIQPDKPQFTFVRIDFFGPLLVKQGRSRVKRSGCLFTCLVVKAAHIEIADGLDTGSFLDALRRFIARRGKREEIRSDRGTNFQGGGAEQKLKECINEWNAIQLNEFLRQREVKWKFNPSAASHMGGAWKRLIRSVKRTLRQLDEKLVNYETLTGIAVVEAILNRRLHRIVMLRH